MNDLKQILLTCCLIAIQQGTVKLVLNKFCDDGSYNQPVFILENNLENNYFERYSVSQFNHYQRSAYFNGISTTRDNTINPLSQFTKYRCQRKSSSLSNYLKKNCDRMKTLLKIDVMLQDEVVDTRKIINNTASSNQ